MAKKNKSKEEVSELSLFEATALKELKRVIKLPVDERKPALQSLCNIISGMKGDLQGVSFVRFFEKVVPLLDKEQQDENMQVVLAFIRYLLNTLG